MKTHRVLLPTFGQRAIRSVPTAATPAMRAWCSGLNWRGVKFALNKIYSLNWQGKTNVVARMRGGRLVLWDWRWYYDIIMLLRRMRLLSLPILPRRLWGRGRALLRSENWSEGNGRWRRDDCGLLEKLFPNNDGSCRYVLPIKQTFVINGRPVLRIHLLGRDLCTLTPIAQ